MDTYDLLAKLVRSSLEFDKKNVEATALMIVNKIKKERPETAAEITKALSYSGYESSTARSLDMSPLPVDRETRYSLVKLSEPVEIPDPILDEYVRRQLDDFIKEREMITKFLDEDIIPPNSVLLSGAPGVGKTYIARWISYKLNLPLVTLDLASSISSFLGRSGQNIRSIFEYAINQNAVLFLDELDSIAKRRDDSSDLGELKRLVNVLLKELESCPSTCVVIGATNHPELLDKAIWRRFDRSLTIPMPEENARMQLLQRHLGKLNQAAKKTTVEYLSRNAKNINAADICKMCEHIKRQTLINSDQSVDLLALAELFKVSQLETREEKILICKQLKKEFPKLSQREISQITQIPLTSVSRYLAKGMEE
ncbi:MAG: ATP-binding protein [Clostridiales Family XIII bacterium]|nr:ATP-binding protein [Clostridiales Family XIII bacterium]